MIRLPATLTFAGLLWALTGLPLPAGQPLNQLTTSESLSGWKLLFEGIDHTMRQPSGAGGEYYLTDAFQYMVDHGAKIRVAEVAGW